MSAITCDHGDLPYPTPSFSTLVANKRLPPIDAWVTLAWPLGDAWVAQGPPKGHPNPIPIPNPIGRGSQNESQLRLLFFLAKSEEPIAKSRIVKYLLLLTP